MVWFAVALDCAVSGRILVYRRKFETLGDDQKHSTEYAILVTHNDDGPSEFSSDRFRQEKAGIGRMQMSDVRLFRGSSASFSITSILSVFYHSCPERLSRVWLK